MQYQFDGERERRAEFAMPKRTKQMGGIEQRLRIFVEDYVYTYLYQYGKSGGGAEKLAALVGKYYELEGQRVLLISGAIQAKGTVQEGGTERFGDETWEYIGGQLQQYFKGMTVVGWVHCQPGFGAFLTAKDEQFHREYFKEDWQVLFAMDTVDRLDSFYLYNEDGSGLRQARGYFVYYDRNREMQEYMLDNSMIRPREEAAEIETAVEQPKEGARRRKKPTQEERMDAAKEIRRVLQKRETVVKQAKREHDLMLLAVSGVLCVVCVCMGMAMMQSLGRLQLVEKELTAMQTAYQTLAENLEDARVQSVFAVQKQPQTAEEQPEQKRSYTVESGDSLGFISRKFYGDSSGIRKIMEANGLANADMIFEGQTLLIP